MSQIDIQGFVTTTLKIVRTLGCAGWEPEPRPVGFKNSGPWTYDVNVPETLYRSSKHRLQIGPRGNICATEDGQWPSIVACATPKGAVMVDQILSFLSETQVGKEDASAVVQQEAGEL